MEIAQGMEAAGQDVQKLQQQQQSQTVQHIQQKLPHKPTFSNSYNNQHQARVCYRCDGNHQQSTCRFRDAICRSCGKKGHISKVCRSKPQHRDKDNPLKPQQNYIQVDGEIPPVPCPNQGSASKEDIYHLFTVRDRSNPMMVKLKINSSTVDMEVDTGAALSLINESTV